METKFAGDVAKKIHGRSILGRSYPLNEVLHGATKEMLHKVLMVC